MAEADADVVVRAQAEEKRSSPDSMYQLCLNSFVRYSTKSKYLKGSAPDAVNNVPDLRLIRFLPPFVLIDILHTMAKDADAHQLFCGQLRDVRLLAKLLNFIPARQRLFRCIGIVLEESDFKEQCMSIISEAFQFYVEDRYRFVVPNVRQAVSGNDRLTVISYRATAKLRKLSHQRRKQLDFQFFREEDDSVGYGRDRSGGGGSSRDCDSYIEEMEREEDEELGAGTGDYFFYCLDGSELITLTKPTRGGGGGATAMAAAAGEKVVQVKTTDLRRSDQVWERVFQDGGASTVDKSNGRQQQSRMKRNLNGRNSKENKTTTSKTKSRNGKKSSEKEEQLNDNDTAVDEEMDDDEDFQVLSEIMDTKEIVYLIRQRRFMATINMGLQIGSFLAEAGWLHDALQVYQVTLGMIQCLDDRERENFLLKLDCAQRILNGESRFCLFNAAHKTSLTINAMIELALDRQQKLPACLLARICKERAMMHFVRSEYDLSFIWSVRALELLHHSTVSERVAIEVLLQAGKSCVVKRQYKRANMLITMAVSRTLALYGKQHQRYADALLDYGFYLLNVDLIVNSVNVYTEALEIKKAVFGELNLNVGTANEDLAYALYVKEYSSGEFAPAREHIDQAINIMDCLVPWNRLMLASAQRVKALILEEIALDQGYEPLLEQSEKLHESALQLSLEAFGEINVQTAKHYGNLGRLYQSMMRFEAAEKMHKRAIKIKTDLLGAYDYEVGLSIGHLASLYNYQMEKFREAEELYMKSIEISLRLFGESYSGLEYDYRGLCHIYELLHDMEKYLEYSRILDNWRNLRRRNEELDQMIAAEEEEEELEDKDAAASMDEVIGKFFDSENGSVISAMGEGLALDAGSGGGGGGGAVVVEGNRGSSVS